MFTAADIKNAKFDTKKKYAYYVREKANRPGFAYRISPKQNLTFVYFYVGLDGKERVLDLGKYPGVTLFKAREKYDFAKELLLSGVDPKVHYKNEREKWLQELYKSDNAGTFQELIDIYLNYLEEEGSPRTLEAAKTALYVHAIPAIGSKTLANQVTSNDISSVLLTVYEKGAKTQSNRLWSYLRAAYNYVIQNNKSIHNKGIEFNLSLNPVADIPKPYNKESVGERTLSRDELLKFWCSFNNDSSVSISIRNLFKLLILTGGQRVSTILESNWSEVSIEDKLWLVPQHRTKTKTEHQFPLNNAALEVLIEMKSATNSNLLFPSRKIKNKTLEPMKLSTVSRVCNQLCKLHSSNFEKFTPRDLRRTSKTMMGMAGISKEMRDRLQHHKFYDTSSLVYDKYDYLKELRKCVKKWEKYLRKKVGLPI